MILVWLFWDILMSATIVPTCFYLLYLFKGKITKMELPLILISLIILLFYTRNFFYLFGIPMILFLRKHKYFGISNNGLRLVIDYLLFYHFNLSFETLISLIVSVLIFALLA